MLAADTQEDSALLRQILKAGNTSAAGLVMSLSSIVNRVNKKSAYNVRKIVFLILHTFSLSAKDE